ncbi:glutathione S-transferase domain-containing protein [Mycobacteroides abscessus subsp. abscessus]|nr:glutathione S-transferase domain-containing protein [Mycobacteroides abscessus subsp. abscessus]
MLFPHLYGPLPLSAVVDVTPYPRSEDGTFAPFDGRSA